MIFEHQNLSEPRKELSCFVLKTVRDGLISPLANLIHTAGRGLSSPPGARDLSALGVRTPALSPLVALHGRVAPAGGTGRHEGVLEAQGCRTLSLTPRGACKENSVH